MEPYMYMTQGSATLTLLSLRFVRDRFVLRYVKSDRTPLAIGSDGDRWTGYLLGFRQLYVVDFHAELLAECRKHFARLRSRSSRTTATISLASGTRALTHSLVSDYGDRDRRNPSLRQAPSYLGQWLQILGLLRNISVKTLSRGKVEHAQLFRLQHSGYSPNRWYCRRYRCSSPHLGQMVLRHFQDACLSLLNLP
jgi:hypothetical protein